MEKAIKLDSNSMRSYAALGHSYRGLGKLKEALLAWAHQHDSYGNHDLAYIYRNSDFNTAMQAWIKKAATPDAPIYSGDFTVAVIFAYLKDKENTFKHLEQAYLTHDRIEEMKNWVIFDFLRDDPRYKELYRKLNFDAYDEYRKTLK